MASVTRSGVWSCLVAAVLFGASTPAASVIADDMTPLVLAGLLYLGAAIVVAPWWLTRPPDRAALRRDRRSLAVAIVAGGAIGPALLTAGLVDTPAATASLLLNMELVATVVLAATLFREHLGRNMLLAAALVTVAGALLVWEPGATANLSALLIVGACVCWGLDNSVTSRIDQVSPQHVTFLKGIVAGSVNLVLGLVISGVGDVGVWAVLGALVVGAFGYGVSITLWVRGAHQLGAAHGQVIFATAPFIGAVLAWVAAVRAGGGRADRGDGDRGRAVWRSHCGPPISTNTTITRPSTRTSTSTPTAITTTPTLTASAGGTATSTSTPRSSTRIRTCQIFITATSTDGGLRLAPQLHGGRRADSSRPLERPADDLRIAPGVERLQLGDGEAATFDDRRDVAVQVAAARHTSLHAVEAVLPDTHLAIRRPAVFHEVEGAARTQDASDLADGSDRVGDAVQRPCRQRGVDGIVL